MGKNYFKDMKALVDQAKSASGLRAKVLWYRLHRKYPYHKDPKMGVIQAFRKVFL